MKKPFLTMTALSALVLISPALQDTAAANKPNIRIAKPNIKVNVDTKRLTNKATTRKTGKGIVKAGPQPEPPTRPRPDFTRTTMIAPPLPRPRPVIENADPDNNVFDQIVETLQSIEPPTDGESEAYDEFEEDEDGLIGDIDAPAGPELVLSNGFEDVFLTFGGVTPEFEFPVGAIPEFPGAGSGGNPFEDPGSLVRRPRYGEGMDGPPAAGGDAPGNPGHASSSGWVQQPSGPTPGRTVWSKNWDSIGTATYVVQTNADGSITGTLTLWVDADDNQPGRVDSTTETTFSPPDENGSRTVTTKTTDSNGNTTEQTESENSETPRAPTPTDQDADGVDDDRESERVIITDPESEQPAPHDNDTGRGTGGCGMWTPFGGCTGTGPKAWETTSQPNPTDDGSATVRSAGASIGPEAVTNGGDGSFGAEGNSGRGSGFGIDPCATVAGCGDGSGGPDNPVGSVDAAHAADR